MRTITRKRFVEENLDFTEIADSEDAGIKWVRYVVIDDDCAVYDGVEGEDGSFNDGFTLWESVDVCESLAGSAVMRSRSHTSTLRGGTRRACIFIPGPKSSFS